MVTYSFSIGEEAELAVSVYCSTNKKWSVLRYLPGKRVMVTPGNLPPLM